MSIKRYPLGGGGGGGAVSSVNGETGAVVIDAADVGATSLSVDGVFAGTYDIDTSPVTYADITGTVPDAAIPTGVARDTEVATATLGRAYGSGALAIGLKGQNMDPFLGLTGTSVQGSGITIAALCTVEETGTLSNVTMVVGTAAATPTSGQCFAAIFDAAGTRLAVSTDISGALGLGVKTWAMTSPTATLPAGTQVYAALLVNAVTPPALGRAGLLLAAWGVGSLPRRVGAIPGAVTAMQTSFSPAALVTPGGAFWMGVS